MDCPEVMGPHRLISEDEVAAAIKGLKIGKITFTNYKKADWTQFMEDTESTFA